MELKKLIKELRLRAGLTQADLARKTKSSSMHISQIENPKRDIIPSEDFLRRVAKACALTPDEEPELLKKLLVARAKARAPEEIQEILESKTIHQYVGSDSMPINFVERIKSDLQGKDIAQIAKKLGITEADLKAVIYYRGTLTRRQVITLAQELGQPVQDYLLLAEYMPDEVIELFKINKIGMLFRSLEELSEEELDQFLDGIINIMQAYLRKTGSDKRSGKGTDKGIPEEK